MNSLHPLLEQRQTPRLTNDNISPLHNNDANKEGSMTSVLQFFPFGITLKVQK